MAKSRLQRTLDKAAKRAKEREEKAKNEPKTRREKDTEWMRNKRAEMKAKRVSIVIPHVKTRKSGSHGRPVNAVAIQNAFVPRFLDDLDKRTAVARLIKQRYETLLQHTGTDSFQRELLCKRAIFISLQLETMEVEATQTGKFDRGPYVQMVNSLVGLLRTLGLENKAIKTFMPWKGKWKEAAFEVIDQPPKETEEEDGAA